MMGYYGSPQMGQGYNNQYVPQTYQPTYQQQYQPTYSQATSISGKVVNGLGDITFQDVPTSGVTSYFPMADGSAIFAKRLTADGNIVTVRYRPEVMEPAQPDPIAVLSNKVDSILDILNRGVVCESDGVRQEPAPKPAKRLAKQPQRETVD